VLVVVFFPRRMGKSNGRRRKLSQWNNDAPSVNHKAPFAAGEIAASAGVSAEAARRQTAGRNAIQTIGRPDQRPMTIVDRLRTSGRLNDLRLAPSSRAVANPKHTKVLVPTTCRRGAGSDRQGFNVLERREAPARQSVQPAGRPHPDIAAAIRGEPGSHRWRG
jgi:hypothetical protein